ncbi:MAG: hypothetical protein R3250_11935 [Melioribacteraceae bacterium]|nr:hypothetical protein [Melioribacteraceae bacterium]
MSYNNYALVTLNSSDQTYCDGDLISVEFSYSFPNNIHTEPTHKKSSNVFLKLAHYLLIKSDLLEFRSIIKNSKLKNDLFNNLKLH